MAKKKIVDVEVPAAPAPAPAAPVKRPIKKRTIETIEEESAESDAGEVDQGEKQRAEISEKLAEFQSRFEGEGYKYRVEHFDPIESAWEYLDSFPSDEMDPYQRCKRMGGGRFRLTFLDNHGRTVSGGRFEIRVMKVAVEPEKPATSGVQDNPVIAAMQMQLNLLTELLKTTLTNRPADTPRSDLSEIIKSLHALKEMEPKAKEDTLEKTLGVFLKMRDLFDGRGESESKPGLMGEISQVVEVLKNLKGGEAAPPAALPPPVRVAGTQPIPVNPNKGDRMDPIIGLALSYAPKFAIAAEKKRPAQEWANYLVTVLETEIVPLLVDRYSGLASEDKIWDKLIAAGSLPSTMDQIFAYAPRLLPYREWCAAVVRAAVSIITGEPEGPAASVPGDVPVNGPTSDASTPSAPLEVVSPAPTSGLPDGAQVIETDDIFGNEP